MLSFDKLGCQPSHVLLVKSVWAGSWPNSAKVYVEANIPANILSLVVFTRLVKSPFRSSQLSSSVSIIGKYPLYYLTQKEDPIFFP